MLEPDAALDPELEPELDIEFDALPNAPNEPEFESAPEFALGMDPELAFEPLLAPLTEADPEKRKKSRSVKKANS